MHHHVPGTDALRPHMPAGAVSRHIWRGATLIPEAVTGKWVLSVKTTGSWGEARVSVGNGGGGTEVDDFVAGS